ncbi:MAG TPA: dihydrodipicolinate synthase family protein [Gemmatimonadaceae bacterium]|jgi:4-hydroxy-2-oxoglutarate aldolase|nr:dihydrodipicolinate synthase family protein [Gemmatimonadaceae bacterium]
MAVQLRGVIAPVVTPFDASTGEIAAEEFGANITAHLDEGLAGVLVAGSTGEAALLDDGERQALIELARARVPSEKLLLVGAGAESTRATTARARDAAERGADAVLVVAPHYYGPAMTDEALSAHYRRVADESAVPVLLYNIPKYMHFALSTRLVGELAQHENIIGMKDSSGDLELLRQYIALQSESFTVLTGHAGTLLSALRMGAGGAILAASLFAAPLALEVCDAFAAGDDARASSVQERLALLNKEIVGTLGVPGIKAALDLAGLNGGAPRAPLLDLSTTERDRVASLVRSAGMVRAA